MKWLSDTFSGKVQTVNGLTNPNQLGKTLVHEHLSMTFDVAFVAPKDEEANNSTCLFTMENLGWIRYNPYSHQSNLQLNGSDCEAAIAGELAHYRANGGGTVVECTTHGISRRAHFLRNISQSSGVHIVAGTGYYVAASQEEALFYQPTELLADVMREEIVNGCAEAPDVRCGIIGEIGCSWPLHNFEKRVLEAAANVQMELKCPVSIHPGRNPASPFQVLRTFLEAGGDATQVALCHLDRTIFEEEHLFNFAELGSYLEFDLFGTECSHYQLNHQVDMPSDAQRIDRLLQLVDEGYEDKLLISHDIHTKHRLIKYGGHGYSHILEHILPRMLERGFRPSTVNKISTENPAAWLTFR